ncbi:hypothetical protein CCP2SC5_1960002 [Azospirillaceae bacterium]
MMLAVMAKYYRKPDYRQLALLPVDMMDWLSENDIVHLIVDAVSLMDLSAFHKEYKISKASNAPFAPQVLLSLFIYAYRACCEILGERSDVFYGLKKGKKAVLSGLFESLFRVADGLPV